jgi:hypothetical protein
MLSVVKVLVRIWDYEQIAKVLEGRIMPELKQYPTICLKETNRTMTNFVSIASPPSEIQVGHLPDIRLEHHYISVQCPCSNYGCAASRRPGMHCLYHTGMRSNYHCEMALATPVTNTSVSIVPTATARCSVSYDYGRVLTHTSPLNVISGMTLKCAWLHTVPLLQLRAKCAITMAAHQQVLCLLYTVHSYTVNVCHRHYTSHLCLA